MIAVAGFLVSVVSLSSAVAIGGPEVFTDGVWNRWFDGDSHWGWNDDWSNRRWRHGRDGGPQATRDLAWSGGDSLEVDVPAEVRYTQAPGAGKVTVSGPEREVADLEVEDGHIRYARHGHHHWGDLTIVISAPAVSHFSIDSNGSLAIENYKQDKLSLDISGSANVTVKGETKGVELAIAGSGATDLTDLKVSDADVTVAGSGEATLGPTGVANIDISGSGDVTLLNHPTKLESNVSGSGSIHQKDGATASSGPPEPPAPPRPPKPPKPV